MDDLVPMYLESINSVKKQINELKEERRKETSRELKHKLTTRIVSLEHVLMDLQRTYSYVLNYYNKDAPIKQWI